MTNKELTIRKKTVRLKLEESKKISDELFKEDVKDIEKILAYRSFYRRVVLDGAISIICIVSILIFVILMVS